MAEGAHATGEVLRPAEAAGRTVAGRLRKDAALWSLPKPEPPGQRKPSPTHGKQGISLAERAGQRGGRSSGLFESYGARSAKKYKSFLATSHPAGGVIPVVLVDDQASWRASFCADSSASVADIPALVADRSGLAITFRECEQVVGVGQPQVRSTAANVGASHICLRTYTHTDRGVSMEPAVGESGGPLGVAVGRCGAATTPCRRTPGVATKIAGRGNPSGPASRDDRAEIRAAADRPLKPAA